MGKGKGKLSRRITFYGFVFGMFLSSSIAVLGIAAYRKQSIEHYDQYINNILRIAQRQIKVSDIERWLAEGVDDEYADTKDRMNDIKEASQYAMREGGEDKDYRLSFLFIVAPYRILEAGEVMYVMSAYIESDRIADPDRRPDQLGDVSREGDGYEGMQVELMGLYRKMVEEGGDEPGYVNNSNQYYENLRTGVLPIKNEQGELVAFINAAVSVEGIRRNLRGYVIVVVIGTVIVMGTFLSYFLWRMKQSFTKPIALMLESTFDFMRQSREKKKPSDMEFKELSLRTGDEMECLSDNLNHMMRGILDYLMSIEQMSAEEERVRTEFDLAKVIQRNMVPSKFPAFPERTDFDVYAMMWTAGDVGEDFYDFFLQDENHICLVVASVTGGGLSSALFLVLARTLLKNFLQMGLPPERALAETNNRLCENNETNLFVTAFVGVLDLHGGNFRYAGADHPVPYLRRGGSRFEAFGKQRGFVMGGLGSVPYESHEIKLSQGDTLFFYTEGLLEAVKQMDLLAHLNQAVERESGLEGVLKEIDAKWSGAGREREQKKDVTTMLFRYYGGY